MGKRIIVGITGASGAAYAQCVIQQMLLAGVEVRLVVSPLGQRLLHDELGMEGVDVTRLAGVQDDQQARRAGLIQHAYRDVGADIASGSFPTDGMVVVPCSSNTLSAVANGQAQNLLHRAAAVTLKERRRLVLLHREMPLSLVDIRNMQLATEAGVVICPASPGFYLLPQSIEDLVDFVAARVLDLLEVPHNLGQRWGNKKAAHDQPSIESQASDTPL